MNSGWMVNFQMRRVEPVETKQDPTENPSGYAIWKGPRRTYKLHVSQVYQTERSALVELERRMNARYLKLQAQLAKYRNELCSVRETLQPVPLRNGDYAPEELALAKQRLSNDGAPTLADVKGDYPVCCSGKPVERDERAAFEAWAKSEGHFNIRRNPYGYYRFTSAAMAWKGWQARAVLERKR